MFRTTLHVAHIDCNRWRLTRPLVWEGRTQYYVIMGEFETDFASIPKPVRWLLDSAGRNSEAAVLHDAVWRESQRPVPPGEEPRVDPWDADGMFRSSLRDTGSTALTRGLMWFAVRTTAMVNGRFGAEGPSLPVKLFQLAGMFTIGAVAALAPTIVAALGLVVFWIANWIVALVWQVFERLRLNVTPNWPWPRDQKQKQLKRPPDWDLLVIIDKPTEENPSAPRADRLEALLRRTHIEVTNEDIEHTDE
jgi:hypothetical protein